MVISEIYPQLFKNSIFLSDIFRDLTCLVNADSIFTLNCVNVEPSWKVYSKRV